VSCVASSRGESSTRTSSNRENKFELQSRQQYRESIRAFSSILICHVTHKVTGVKMNSVPALRIVDVHLQLGVRTTERNIRILVVVRFSRVEAVPAVLSCYHRETERHRLHLSMVVEGMIVQSGSLRSYILPVVDERGSPIGRVIHWRVTSTGRLSDSHWC
jgi:hypothetical protein